MDFLILPLKDIGTFAWLLDETQYLLIGVGVGFFGLCVSISSFYLLFLIQFIIFSYNITDGYLKCWLSNKHYIYLCPDLFQHYCNRFAQHSTAYMHSKAETIYFLFNLRFNIFRFSMEKIYSGVIFTCLSKY